MAPPPGIKSLTDLGRDVEIAVRPTRKGHDKALVVEPIRLTLHALPPTFTFSITLAVGLIRGHRTSATFGHIISYTGHGGRVFARRMRSRRPEDAANPRGAGAPGHVFAGGP